MQIHFNVTTELGFSEVTECGYTGTTGLIMIMMAY